ncbi:hypothetical protein M8C21_022878 [Ambrosia artemisiifolia]|uniref:Uncharacterized protein n=1 Tax=Ambrosia artemisiifolia TaxID=4212 RepID=A0AAD5CYL8_AMBAR|nr:hypothetical protein M8C21_022878 [Ambrosia artemisiifolia]
MASSLTLRKVITRNHLTRSINQLGPAVASASYRSLCFMPDHGYDHVVEVDRNKPFGRGVANAFRTAYYSLVDSVGFSPIRILGVALNLDKDYGGGSWKVRQTGEALLLKCDMSGVIDDIKVTVERNKEIVNLITTNNNVASGTKLKHLGRGCETKYFGLYVRMFEYVVNEPAVLVIKRKGKGVSKDEEGHLLWINLPYNVYNNNKIKIEEKNKVLKVTIPKLKPTNISGVVKFLTT